MVNVTLTKRTKYEIALGITAISGILAWIETGNLLSASIVSLFILAVFVVLLVIGHTVDVSTYDKVTIEDIDLMTGTEFAEYVAYVLKQRNYKRRKPKNRNSRTTDLVLYDPVASETVIVLTKRYKGKVGRTAVYEAINLKKKYDVDRAWIVTNRHFTLPAIHEASIEKVRMINRNNLIHMIRQNEDGR